MSQPESLAGPSAVEPIVESESARPCLACGYNLQGLGEEPRCPECGLLNIPEGYRRQVWELVDSGKWFFSSFLGVFRKRPPGWWWSLDRPGDVKQALRIAFYHAMSSLLVVLIAGALAGTVTYTRDSTRIFIAGKMPEDPSKVVVYSMRMVQSFSLAGDPSHMEFENQELRGVGANEVPKSKVSVHKEIRFSWAFLAPCLILYVWLFLVWAYPACIGIWTQIRKSLPSFARAPLTILAASLYEVHRLFYASVFAALLLLFDAGFRWIGYGPNGLLILATWFFGPLLVVGLAAAGWIGPLRSDYTRQLVRSRRHAVRIFLMYAVAFPAITVFAVVALIVTIMMERL